MQVAVVIAKVARNDYPRQWPALFADLLAHGRSGSALTVRRTYLVLHHILKELASKRLAADKKVFAEVCSMHLLLHAPGSVLQLCCHHGWSTCLACISMLLGMLRKH